MIEKQSQQLEFRQGNVLRASNIKDSNVDYDCLGGWTTLLQSLEIAVRRHETVPG